MYKKSILYFFVFAFSQIIIAQNSKKDSITTSKFIIGLNTYYKDPNYYKSNFEKIDSLISINLNKNNENEFWNISKSIINDYYSYFEGFEFDFNKSIKLLLESERIKKKYNRQDLLPGTYRGMAIVWKSQKNYEKEKYYLDLTKKYAIKFKNIKEQLKAEIALNQFALNIYDNKYPKKINKSLNDSVIKVYKLISEKALNNNLFSIAGNCNFLISRAMRVNGKIEESLEYVLKSQQYYELDKNIIGEEKSLYAIATYYRKSGEPELSMKILLRCIENVKQQGNSKLLKTRYLGMSNAAATAKNYKLAYDYYVLYKDISDKMTNKENYQKVLASEAEYKLNLARELDSLKLANQTIVFKKQAEYKSKIKYLGIIITLIGLLVFFIIGYFFYRFKTIKTENEFFKKSIEVSQLENTIQLKKKQLSALIADNLSQIRTKEKIVQQLNSISNNEENLKSLLLELKSEKIEDDRSSLLKSNLELINSNFIENLKEKFPDLTKTEIEIASLTKLGLNTKQIAVLRNVSIDAIKKGRSRLSKKLVLAEGQKLKDFLNRI